MISLFRLTCKIFWRQKMCLLRWTKALILGGIHQQFVFRTAEKDSNDTTLLGDIYIVISCDISFILQLRLVKLSWAFFTVIYMAK